MFSQRNNPYCDLLKIQCKYTYLFLISVPLSAYFYFYYEIIVIILCSYTELSDIFRTFVVFTSLI